MEIGFYRSNDFQQVEKILKSTGLYHKPLDKKKILQKQISYNPKSIIIAKENGKVVGVVFVLYNPWQSFICHLGVHPDHQNQGVGTKLLHKAEAVLKKRGVKTPTLFIERPNKEVMGFYKKQKWYVWGRSIDMEKKLK